MNMGLVTDVILGVVELLILAIIFHIQRFNENQLRINKLLMQEVGVEFDDE